MKIITEIGLAHNGDLREAEAYIRAVAAAGVNGVKFQCHAGDKCNQFRHGTQSVQDADRQAYYRRTAFTRSQWEHLSAVARSLGLEFGCSVWSVEGIELMRGLVDFWKVPSGEVANIELLTALAHEKNPAVVSSGMSSWKELHEAMGILGDRCIPLQCTSQYPCPPERVGVHRVQPDWSTCLTLTGGLSDHSGAIWPGIIAAWLGADMLEVHVCWDKRQQHPDTSSSLTIDELTQLAQGVRFVERMRDNPVDKDELAKSPEIQEMKRIFGHA